jgi:hypothetical protein
MVPLVNPYSAEYQIYNKNTANIYIQLNVDRDSYLGKEILYRGNKSKHDIMNILGEMKQKFTVAGDKSV